jgi:thiamine-monophosphate kinase
VKGITPNWPCGPILDMPKIRRMPNEDDLIRRIARALPSEIGRGKGLVLLGIGDDAAILRAKGDLEWATSCDAFIEGIHFLADIHPADSVGYKALVRATSDLVAMGAKPWFFLLTLALPANSTEEWLNQFLRGMSRAARLLKMRLIGGDTTRSKIVSASITVFGQVKAGEALTRSGARPGDWVYVSGQLGRAQLGLELKGKREKEKGKMRSQLVATLQPHLYPRIRVDLGLFLAQHRIPSAMMDLSDGLSTDLARLCQASGVGARLWADRIPKVTVPQAVGKLLSRRRVDALQLALHGGDDYELLFTVPQRKVKLLQDAPGFAELTHIGQIMLGHHVLIERDEETKALEPGGWDPFR